MSLLHEVSRVHLDLMDGRVRLSRAGAVVAGTSPSLPWIVVDAAEREVAPVSSYLRDRLLGDVSPLTCRSYAFDLLRWFRVLWTVDVGWEQATEAEAAAMVGWLRSARNPQRQRRRAGGYPPGSVNPKTGKRVPASGYAPATIAHSLSVVHGFYAFHLHFGRGPVLNPVPENRARRSALAHRSPIEAPGRHRRGRLRPKVPVRQPRAIPDAQWDELFAAMRCTRDRALLACYVSSGARASELLGVGLSDIDWQKGQLWVISKGTRERQPVPVSPEALAYLAAYLDEAGLPEDGGSVWRTRRGEVRPLTYWAARRIIQRTVEQLGMNWTLHDARHTAATKLARDPAMTLAEVQTILRHAHVTTTALYTVVGLEDLVDKLAEHYSRPPQVAAWSHQYDPEDVAVVFGAR
ncbi:integrase [Streptomyces rutgersensis]|uniref:tyrosine-type recombinase/integrase n=1 Tax=Streptomyces rutgersensis TaxID=53451 RepID=UPI0013C5806D|nr:tyrosine-type recombinase/integrase [Streptomyces rutgersensis]GFH64565.1 integrase [Streptomyces rutgersensis]